MRDKGIQLSASDKAILESYMTFMNGLSEYLGEGYEIVLHSLENLEHSVIKIINGYHTGRKVGAPITDLALSMLAEIEKKPNSSHISYLSKNKKGEPLKATTIAIRSKSGRVIGLMCINFYLNTPVSTILESFIQSPEPKETVAKEYFALTTEELVVKSLMKAREEVMADASILPSNRNKEIIFRLQRSGIFKLKNAVKTSADMLEISKNTIYMHIRNMG